MDGYLTSGQLAKLLNIKRASVYRMVSRGDLPRPEHIGTTALWPTAAIEQWRANRPSSTWKTRRGRATG